VSIAHQNLSLKVTQLLPSALSLGTLKNSSLDIVKGKAVRVKQSAVFKNKAVELIQRYLERKAGADNL